MRGCRLYDETTTLVDVIKIVRRTPLNHWVATMDLAGEDLYPREGPDMRHLDTEATFLMRPDKVRP